LVSPASLLKIPLLRGGKSKGFGGVDSSLRFPPFNSSPLKKEDFTIYELVT
jgi:hypothetical protein